jgi:hypothetical protein
VTFRQKKAAKSDVCREAPETRYTSIGALRNNVCRNILKPADTAVRCSCARKTWVCLLQIDRMNRSVDSTSVDGQLHLISRLCLTNPPIIKAEVLMSDNFSQHP